MRDIFEEIFAKGPLDPVEAARRNMRAPQRRRFYREAGVAEAEGGFGLVLDGRPVKTPARRLLVAPVRALAQMLAAEWNGQAEFVDPSRMPLTRLANSIVDGVVNTPAPVAEEIAKYLGTDLVCYRASGPERLVARQAQHWDPVLAFARDTLNARFAVGEGYVHVAQPQAALTAARAAIPEPGRIGDAWRIGALHSITTLTGSALIALAVLHGAISADAAWAAAHVDEDWNMEQWGRDALALERRAYHEAELRAAAAVLDALRD